MESSKPEIAEKTAKMAKDTKLSHHQDQIFSLFAMKSQKNYTLKLTKSRHHRDFIKFNVIPNMHEAYV